MVKGHAEIEGNEKADRLAVGTHKLPLIYENCRIPKSFIRNQVDKERIRKWKDSRDEESKGRYL